MDDTLRRELLWIVTILLVISFLLGPSSKKARAEEKYHHPFSYLNSLIR